MMSDNTKIGTSLLGLGLLFIALGVLLLFDRFLLSLGNVMFLAGLLMTMGRPLVGMFLEGFGFVNLFGNFFPIALSAMRTMPVIGNVLSMPGVSSVADKLSRASSSDERGTGRRRGPAARPRTP
ncbi:hypothetical protein JL722_2436 [Aureococcus anophagefferens]|nr:hypothetical protein JL722_2436 [Aureococcus anophagefferens]